MTRTLESWTLCLAGLLLVAWCAMAAPSATPSAQAQQSTTTAPDSTIPGATEEPAKEEEKDAKEESSSGASFFPGVRGISGAELERIIQEREAKKAEEDRKARRHADNRQAKPEDKKSDAPAREAEKRPVETPKAAPTKTEPAVKEVPLSEDAAAFLKKQKLSTARIEYVLVKAGEIRADVEKDASALADEPLILYILQYTKRSTAETLAYQAMFRLPLAIYQYDFDQVQQSLAFDRKSRPEDLPPSAVIVADDCVKRLRAARTASLLAAAELYTRLRQLNAAETIYAKLLQENPKDPAIEKSYKVCVDIKNTERPTTPPGVRTSGGNTSKHFNRDAPSSEPGGAPADNSPQPYRR